MASKLGVFFQGPPELGSEATELVRSAPASMWVKGLDPDKWATPARDMFPGKRVIARLWIGGDDQEHEYMARGEKGANDYISLLTPRYDKLLAQGVVDVLGPNEPHPTQENWRAYEDFECQWADVMNTHWLRPWVWSFGVGWPGLKAGGDDMPTAGHFCMSVHLACDAGGGLELHEYGAPSVLSGDGWWTLRYRKTVAELRQQMNLNNLRVLIGECGIDRGLLPGGKRGGWQTFGNWAYPDECGLGPGPMNEARYWCQMSAYDDELLKDDYIVAATPFVTCPTTAWASYDWGGGLIRRSVEKHGQGPTPPPSPPPSELAVRVAELERQVGGLLAWNAALAEAIEDINAWRGLVGQLDTVQAFGQSFVIERKEGGYSVTLKDGEAAMLAPNWRNELDARLSALDRLDD